MEFAQVFSPNLRNIGHRSTLGLVDAGTVATARSVPMLRYHSFLPANVAPGAAVSLVSVPVPAAPPFQFVDKRSPPILLDTLEGNQRHQRLSLRLCR